MNDNNDHYNDKSPKPDWLTPEVQARIREINYAMHVKYFGEEMARVNFLPKAERKKYVFDMIDHAVAKGVNLEKPARGVK